MRWRLILLAVVVIFLATFGYLFIRRDKPPVEIIKQAREGISSAKTQQANIYAKSHLNKAIENYDSAMVYWEEENKRFFLFRNYETTLRFANESIKYSKKATDNASSSSKSLNTETEKILADVQAKIKSFQTKFNHLPLNGIKHQFNKGKLLANEAASAYKNGNLQVAKSKANQAKVIVDKTYKQAYTILSDYFEQYDKWNGWAAYAKHYSQKNDAVAVVIDKYSRECLVYSSGKVIQKFDVELGENWLGTKQYQGDKATPEGIYKVERKKERSSTKYYKALLINYPNEDDKVRFTKNKKNGVIANNSKIGNLIEIHGSGGNGADWTEGCVALTNKNMDILYSKCSVGTPIIIVGSLKSLKEVMK